MQLIFCYPSYHYSAHMARGNFNVERNQMALALIGVLLVQGVFSFSRIQLFAKVSENAMQDIRTQLYEKIVFLPISFFEQRRVFEKSHQKYQRQHRVSGFDERISFELKSTKRLLRWPFLVFQQLNMNEKTEFGSD